MRYIISFVFVFTCMYAQAQEPTYVPMKSNYLYKGIKMDSLFILPYLDTSSARKVNGNVVRQSDAFYWYDSTAWKPLVVGGGSSTDTTSLSNRINSKADTSQLALKLNKSDSSIYYTKYRSDTSRTNIYTAISSKGQNGRWGNDTALIVLAKVHNATGTQLNRGEVVYLSGANGDVASVKRANNKYDSTSATTIGMVKDNIASGDTGWVVTQGQISKINTSAFTAGDIVYIDSIDGKFSKTKPQAPYHMVFLGVVERANAGNGQIYIKPINGYELDELHNVRIITPLNNQILVYSDTQQIWKNRLLNAILFTNSPMSLNQNANNTFEVTIDSATSVQDGYLTTHKFNLFNSKLGASDTVSLSNRINTKLNASDTASISNRINLKLNLSDTANMLATYLRKADTSSLSNRINARVLISDTSAMLTNYQRTSAFPVATFGAGSGASGDTTAFSTSALYGSFYLNAGSDTIIVTGYTGIVQGTSASVTPTIWYNDSLNVTAGATKIVNSPSAVTSTTTGNTVTSLDNTKIPPGNFVWVTTGTVTTKPTYFNLTLIGYRKR